MKKRRAVAADGVTADLQEQGVYRVGVKLLRSEANDLRQRASQRNSIPVRALARHGVKSVGQSYDAHLHGNIFEDQSIGIAGTIAALVMPANNVRDTRPGKLNTADNLMTDHGVVCHFTKFLRVQR